jgi:tetratricopeptide (TPR) repeat protein
MDERREDPPAAQESDAFVGRSRELVALSEALSETAAGRGRVVMLVGEAGIGKTRTAAEFARRASSAGALVLRGGCYEGEWAPPYGPFVEALTVHARAAAPAELRRDLGFGASALSRVLPVLRERLSDIPESVALQPDEERFRLFDAVSQFLITLSRHRPLVLMLDDLHWVDAGTAALLRHVGRTVHRNPLLLIGAYRDVDGRDGSSLGELMGALDRESRCHRLRLPALDEAESASLATAVAAAPVPMTVLDRIGQESGGNPFFIKELVQQWTETGRPERLGREASVPASIQHVIRRRLERLSDETIRVLTVATAFTGPFHLAVVGDVAGLDEDAALAAVDAALSASLIQPVPHADAYEFSHALIRSTLYASQNPSRRFRLHRRVAEVMEQLYGDRAVDHAGEIAHQYERSKTLSGADRGATYAIEAALCAEAAAAHDEAARFWRMAIELLPSDDARRSRVLRGLSFALTWSLDVDLALQVAAEAARVTAEQEGRSETARFLGHLCVAMAAAGSPRGGWECSRLGLPYLENRRDETWVRLMVHDLARREAEDTERLGIPLDTAERLDIATTAEKLVWSRWEQIYLGSNGYLCPRTGREVRERFGDHLWWVLYHNGGRDIPLWRQRARESTEQGRIAEAALYLAHLSRCENSLGRFAAARKDFAEASNLAGRLSGSSIQSLTLMAARYELCVAAGEGFEEMLEQADALARGSENAWAFAAINAGAARAMAWLGEADTAMALVAEVIQPLDLAAGWMTNYPGVACDVAEALWLSDRKEHAESIERNLRSKVVEPDLPHVLRDGRRSLAHLCALQGRYEEAEEWFEASGRTLENLGGRPARAMVDYDVALMLVRRDRAADAERAQLQAESALRQFGILGMPGWVRRAELLLGRIARSRSDVQVQGAPVEGGESSADEPTVSFEKLSSAGRSGVFRLSGEVWTLAYDGHSIQLKQHRGIEFLSHLLAHPGLEIHAFELVNNARRNVPANPTRAAKDLRAASPEDAGEHLDPEALLQYRARMRDLRSDLEEASANDDLGHSERIQAEIDFLERELSRAVGLGGRVRRAGSASERARVNVTRAVSEALRRIGRHHPTLGAHLRDTIRTGTTCSYRPDPRLPTRWET